MNAYEARPSLFIVACLIDKGLDGWQKSLKVQSPADAQSEALDRLREVESLQYH